MTYFTPIQQWFIDLPRQRKYSLSAALVFILIVTCTLSFWVLSPSYGVLFNHLDERDANQILSQLEQAHIAFELQNNGGDILIDKKLIPQTRLKIMGSGVQLTGSVGFELFDKSDFGMTDFSQKINYQRALQGELERTIASFEEVRQARVHLVIPEHRLFDKEDNQTTAAVTLNLKKNMTHKQIRSIQQLITASVAHMKLANVVVVDQRGNTLSTEDEDSSTSHLATKKSIEHYLGNKVTHMLNTIFSVNHVVVSIDASINYDDLQRELIKPQSHGLVTHEKEITHATPDKTEKNKTRQDITSEKTYQFGSEKELFKRASGTIERLSISVVLPQNTDKQTIEQVQRLVKSTIGFNELRGDTISVEALISSKPANRITPVPLLHHGETSRLNPAFFYLLAVFVLVCGAITLLNQRARRQKRQLLLVELTNWLSHHG